MVKATPKSDTIDIEAKYFPERRGSRLLRRNRIPVRDLHGRDMSRSSGFEWRKCGVDTLSRLVSGGYLSAIEATRPESASAREPLVRLADIVLSGFLVSRFRSDLKGRVFLEPSISALRMAMREDERLRRATSARFERRLDRSPPIGDPLRMRGRGRPPPPIRGRSGARSALPAIDPRDRQGYAPRARPRGNEPPSPR